MNAATAPEPAPKSETSADHVDPNAVVARRAHTAAAVRQRIRDQARSDWELVCVIDDNERLLGTLTAAELLALPDETVLGDVVDPERPRVTADTDQEKMASIALHHKVLPGPWSTRQAIWSALSGPSS